VGVGTDGVSSVPSHDYFEELRAVVSAARARTERADALSPAAALELATIGGARALGLADEIGSLVPGKQADLAVVSLSGSSYLPWEDPAAAVVYGGGPGRIAATLVGGHYRYDQGRHEMSRDQRGGLEWHELTDAASRARGRLLARDPATAAAAPATTAAQ
jgi:5-methylthioadenosine/S-adenosylhomocysteine deaminase